MIKRHIPNAITCGNLLCGCLAIIKCFEGDLVWASYLVGIAAVLDFFDGFAARMLRITSAIGKDLDSLADMVTFGVVPGLMMYKMIGNSFYCLGEPAEKGWTIYPPLSALPDTYPKEIAAITLIALIIPIFSCIRLAKFNNDTRQTESFIGLPTPANAMLICSFPLILEFHPNLSFIFNPIVLCLVSGILSFLLIAPIPMFSLKFKRFGWNGNKRRYTFLLFSLILLVSLQFLAIPLIIVSYVLFSLLTNMFLNNRPRSN